jgi:vacuolar-type H+-ATPase subunit I/STV1
MADDSKKQPAKKKAGPPKKSAKKPAPATSAKRFSNADLGKARAAFLEEIGKRLEAVQEEHLFTKASEESRAREIQRLYQEIERLQENRERMAQRIEEEIQRKRKLLARLEGGKKPGAKG